MTVGTVLVGALAAAVLAWTTIAAVAWIGRGDIWTAPIRWFGAAALVLLALGVSGVPVPWALPPLVLTAGLLIGLAPWDVLQE